MEFAKRASKICCFHFTLVHVQEGHLRDLIQELYSQVPPRQTQVLSTGFLFHFTFKTLLSLEQRSLLILLNSVIIQEMFKINE